MPETAADRIDGTLQRLKETESRVHAYVCILEEHAIAEANRLDGEACRGPLHGVAFAVKEVFDVAGIETAGGCRAFAGRVPHHDATVIERLRAQGAILVGTQVSHELTCGLDEPPTRNPWALDCYPGGSSAGAGVSVALGSAAFALGTDAAGSVRIPAAMTGVVGFKPTLGTVSRHGVMREASAPSIDNVGIVAADVTLAFHVLKAIAGPDPGDAQTLFQPVPGYSSHIGDDLKWRGRRVAFLGERTVAALDGVYEREADVTASFERACGLFGDAGAELVAIELPSLCEAIPSVLTLFSTEFAAAHRTRDVAREAGYHPAVADLIRSALKTPAAEIDQAIVVRARLRQEVDVALAAAGADVFITPTTPRTAMPLATFHPATDLATLIPYTCGFNLTGHPAISVPAGIARNGLPLALQIVGHRQADYSVFEVAKAFEVWNGPAPRAYDTLVGAGAGATMRAT